MNNLVIAFSCYTAAFFFHIISHRFVKGKRRAFSIVGGYCIGLLAMIVLNFYSPSTSMYTLKFVPIILYVLITSIILVLYAAQRLEGKTPSNEILAAFTKKSIQTKGEIMDLFTEKNLVDVRLRTLKEKGLLRQERDSLMITTFGRLVLPFISLYVVIFGVEVGG